jgi:O-methyltransferase/methyltransferase family protein
MTDDLLALIWGYRLSQAVHVVAKLGVADLIAETPLSAVELAGSTGSDAATLQRVLRALAAYGVLDEDEHGRFRLTELGERLRSDVPGSLRDAAIALFRPPMWDAWGHLEESVRTGESAFRLVHGVGIWEFRSDHPEEGRAFDNAMVAQTRAAAGMILRAYDFDAAKTVVDVGGGRGALLEAILEAHPQSEGVLFDQPHVLADVDLGPRVQIVGGSFFESVPAGGDLYLLKWILHDFDDDAAAQILRTIRAACGEQARLLVIERDLAASETTLSDLQMLVVLGGRERSQTEYSQLLRSSGFALSRSIRTEGPLSLLEALPI